MSVTNNHRTIAPINVPAGPTWGHLPPVPYGRLTNKQKRSLRKYMKAVRRVSPSQIPMPGDITMYYFARLYDWYNQKPYWAWYPRKKSERMTVNERKKLNKIRSRKK